MNQLQFLNSTNFEYLLKTYELIKASIQKDINTLESAPNIHEQAIDHTYTIGFYKQSINILIESTFLQIYTLLEDTLYNACETQAIMKKASLSRFEVALREQGYAIDNKYWKTLLDISKIRNCLLHGNGRLDADRYGLDTKETINELNENTHSSLIEIINVSSHREKIAKIKLNDVFLPYFVTQIKNLIASQSRAN